jgi:hypothetical protein
MQENPRRGHFRQGSGPTSHANARLIIKHKTTPDGCVYANVIAILRPGKNDPKLAVPAWFKRASSGGNPPPTASAVSPAAPLAPKPASSAEAPSNKPQSMAEPPDPAEWQASDYDEATSFPADDSTAAAPAA